MLTLQPLGVILNKSVTDHSLFNPSATRRLAPLFLIIFLDSFGYFLIIPVLLRLFIGSHTSLLPATTSEHVRNLFYGITITLSPLASLLAAPVVGYYSDRFGRKIIMLLCLFLGVFGYLLPIVGIMTRHVSLIIIGRAVAGISTNSQPVAQAAITDFTSGKQKAFFLSLIAFAMTLAMIIGPLAGSYLSDAHLAGWLNVTVPYWLGTILVLLNLILLLVFYNDKGQVLSHDETLTWQQKFDTLIRALKKNKVYLLLIIFFFMEIAWSQYYQAMFLFLKIQFHFTTNQIGLFTGYIGIWMSLGLTLIYRILIKYFSIKAILKWSLIITTLGLIGCNYIASPIMQWIFIIPVAIFTGTAYPSLMALISNRTAKDHQGWVLGSAGTVLGLTWMITGLLSAVLINLYTPLPLYVATTSMLVSLLLFFIFMRERKS